jgi:hypothetical protein
MTSEYFMRCTLTLCLTYCVFLYFYVFLRLTPYPIDTSTKFIKYDLHVCVCMYVNIKTNMRTEKCARRQTGKQTYR